MKDIRDKAAALAAYARQKNDSEMIQWVTDIKVRAERRFGELSSALEKSKGGRPSENSIHDGKSLKSTALAAVNVSPAEAWRCEQLAAMSPEHFEAAVATAKATAGEVTTAFMLREANGVRRVGAPTLRLTGATPMTQQPQTPISTPSNDRRSETPLEAFERMSADPRMHFCWTDEFLESLPPRSESELQALGTIRF